MSLFARNIHFLRKKKELQQAEMPDVIGIARATWSDYENARTEPKIEVLLKISDFFGIMLDDLLRKDLEGEYLKGNILQNADVEKNEQKGNNSRNKTGNITPYKTPIPIIHYATEYTELSPNSSFKDVIDTINALHAQIGYKARKSSH